jgi:DhnA family fructose-bisphosphate aldolase class Ia
MKNRLARIFNPIDGRTVMLAIDHGYFQGPTSGLERIDVSILPLIPEADVLMCTAVSCVQWYRRLFITSGDSRIWRPKHS